MSADLSKTEDSELRQALLTVDGKGRAYKEDALNELLSRAAQQAHIRAFYPGGRTDVPDLSHLP